MPKIEISETFNKCYLDLDAQTQEKVKKVIQFLSENPRHPWLQSKPIQGAPGIYEARVDRNYRMTYERLPGDILRLRVVGKHDEALKKP